MAGLYFFFLCNTCVQYPWRPEEGTESPRTTVTSSCKLPCGFGELNSGPLEEQSILLVDEPSSRLNALMFGVSLCLTVSYLVT